MLWPAPTVAGVHCCTCGLLRLCSAGRHFPGGFPLYSQKLAQKHYNGSDILEVCREAAYERVREALAKRRESGASAPPSPISSPEAAEKGYESDVPAPARFVGGLTVCMCVMALLFVRCIRAHGSTPFLARPPRYCACGCRMEEKVRPISANDFEKALAKVISAPVPVSRGLRAHAKSGGRGYGVRAVETRQRARTDCLLIDGLQTS